MSKIWKSVQLFVAFHRDRAQRERRFPYLWPPKNARATITDRRESGQEAFLLIKGEAEARDVQIKVWPARIVLRRDEGLYWSGVVVTDHSVAVRVAGRWIEIRHDGAIKSAAEEEDGDVTFLEADGTVYRFVDLAEIIVSPDGSNISRRTPTEISAITPSGVLIRKKEEEG